MWIKEPQVWPLQKIQLIMRPRCKSLKHLTGFAVTNPYWRTLVSRPTPVQNCTKKLYLYLVLSRLPSEIMEWHCWIKAVKTWIDGLKLSSVAFQSAYDRNPLYLVYNEARTNGQRQKSLDSLPKMPKCISIGWHPQNCIYRPALPDADPCVLASPMPTLTYHVTVHRKDGDPQFPVIEPRHWCSLPQDVLKNWAATVDQPVIG